MSDSTTYYAYFIAPMGETGSQTRKNYLSVKDVLRQTIGSACEIKGGDDVLEDGQVYKQVHDELKNAHFAVADISEQNVNVYYEIGFCKAIDKPMIFLKRQNSEKVPIDLGIPKWVEYDLSGGWDEINKTMNDLRAHYYSIEYKLREVQPLRGSEGSIDDEVIDDILQRIRNGLRSKDMSRNVKDIYETI